MTLEFPLPLMRFLILVVTLAALASTSSLSRDSRKTLAPSLASITVKASAPSQTVGSAVFFSAIGVSADGSTRDITRSVTWSGGTSTVVVLRTANSQVWATCISAGSSRITATDGTVSDSASITCTSNPTRGSGAGPLGTETYNQGTCGNYPGASYET